MTTGCSAHAISVVVEDLQDGPVDPQRPVVVLTAQPGHRFRAVLASVRGLISKPVDLPVLQARNSITVQVCRPYKSLDCQHVEWERQLAERADGRRDSEDRFRNLPQLAPVWCK